MALSHLVVQYESNFCTVALQFMEEEKNYPLPSPATTGRTTAGMMLQWSPCNLLALGPRSELSAGPSFCWVLSPRVKSWPHRYLQFLSSQKNRKGKKEGPLDPLISFLFTLLEIKSHKPRRVGAAAVGTGGRAFFPSQVSHQCCVRQLLISHLLNLYFFILGCPLPQSTAISAEKRPCDQPCHHCWFSTSGKETAGMPW